MALCDRKHWHYETEIATKDGKELQKGLKEFISYYNNRRTHQSLNNKTPFDWYEYAA